MSNSNEESPSFRDAVSAALRKSGAANVVPGEAPTPRALLGVIGGIRGVIESALPTVVFFVVFTITHDVVVSVVGPIALALIFIVARAGARAPMGSAVTGGVLIGLAALLSVLTGKAQNNFVPGMVINSLFLLVLLVSLLMRKPLIAVIVGFVLGDPGLWFSDRAKRRATTIATWAWVGLFAVRLAIEVPLYLAANVSALAVVRLITSVPLYAAVLWLTWLLIRSVYRADGDSVGSAEPKKVS